MPSLAGHKSWLLLCLFCLPLLGHAYEKPHKHVLFEHVVQAMRELDAACKNMMRTFARTYSLPFIPSSFEAAVSTQPRTQANSKPGESSLFSRPMQPPLHSFERTVRAVSSLDCPFGNKPFTSDWCGNGTCQLNLLICDGKQVDADGASPTSLKNCLVKRVLCEGGYITLEPPAEIVYLRCGSELLSVYHEGVNSECQVLFIQSSNRILSLDTEIGCSADMRLHCAGQDILDPEAVEVDIRECSLSLHPCHDSTCRILAPVCTETSGTLNCSFGYRDCYNNDCYIETCACPLDYSGVDCRTRRKYECSILPADPLECKSVQGISDELDDDPICIQAKKDQTLELKFRLFCNFIEPPQPFFNEQLSFNYTAYDGDRFSVSKEDISGQPLPGFIVLLQAFDFNMLSDKSTNYSLVLTPTEILGGDAFAFKFRCSSFDSKYMKGGRLYLELSLMSYPPGLSAVNYYRMFVDIDDYAPTTGRQGVAYYIRYLTTSLSFLGLLARYGTQN